MLFDLRLQDVLRRGARTQAMLARPNALDVDVIAVGEKRPFGSLIDRQQDMGRLLAEIQKRVDFAGKGRMRSLVSSRILGRSEG